MNKAIIQGVEAMASAKFLRCFRISSSYTYQRAIDHSNNPDTSGKFLPGRPQHELYAMGGWQEKWLSWVTSDLFVDLHYMSGNYLDTQNLLQVQNRTLLGSGVSLEFIKRMTIAFSVQNILNDQISDLIGYPLPGRSYWGSLEIKI
jgi:iron complex outermembrane receptor protein